MNERFRISELPLDGAVADFVRNEIRLCTGERYGLSRTEGDLLRYLAVNSGRVVTRDEILASVWQLNPERVCTRTVDMHIVKLRSKLQETGVKPKQLLTIRGQGYMLVSSRKRNGNRNARHLPPPIAVPAVPLAEALV